VRAGVSYRLARDFCREVALAFWFSDAHEVFVAEEAGQVIGSYYLCANQAGGGSHVANCGYMTAPASRGRGVARAMLEHSLAHARMRGFRAMQFNFVVSTNDQDLARLRLRDGRPAAVGLQTPGARVRRCARDVQGAVKETGALP
jgi:GNAT superfamily N-acetyltransferase